MYLGHSHLRLLLLLEELLLEQLEAVLGGQRGDGGRGAGAARAEQLLGAGQVEGAVFGILGTKKWAGERTDRLRLGCGFWFPTALTPVQQRNPCAWGTEWVLRGNPGLSALHICGIPRTVFERGFSHRAGRAALAVSGEGRSPGHPGRRQQEGTQTLHHLSVLWLLRLGGVLVPGAFASECSHCPSCSCPPLLGQCQKECAGKAFPGRETNPMECMSLQLFAARPCECYCCVS